jgi:predicted RNA-binding protein
MNVWLCPVKTRSWRIIKTRKLFGTPKQQLETLLNVKPGDLLAFHVLKPVDGIVSVYRVVSEVFENHEDIWGRSRYPFRVRIEPMPHMLRDIDKPIPLSAILGKGDKQSEIEIEPYLKNVWITKISERQYENLQRLFARQP